MVPPPRFDSQGGMDKCIDCTNLYMDSSRHRDSGT